MPVVAGEDDGRVGSFAGEDGVGFLPDAGLYALTPAVKLAQLRGERVCGVSVLRHEQLCRRHCLAEAACGVEPRGYREADSCCGQLLRVHRRFAQHGRNARTGRRRKSGKAAADEITVFVNERHHVRHRADGDEIDVALKHGGAVALAGADKLQRNADSGKLLVRVFVPVLLAVYHGGCGGQRAGGALVMVGYEHVHAERGGILGLRGGGDAAVHGDDERHALRVQRVERAVIDAVALAVAVGDVRDAFQALTAQIIGDDAGGGDAVHVIVAVDRDGLPAAYRTVHTLDRGGHALHQHRVVQAALAAADEPRGLVHGRYAAQIEHRCEQGSIARCKQLRRDHGLRVWDFPNLRFHNLFFVFLSYIYFYLF